jgi:hypothetical protein
LKHKSMFRKQKTSSTPHVDVEELKRQLRREVLGDLRPMLEVQGIQFPNIGGVMSDEERRSSYDVGGKEEGRYDVGVIHRGIPHDGACPPARGAHGGG